MTDPLKTAVIIVGLLVLLSNFQNVQDRSKSLAAQFGLSQSSDPYDIWEKEMRAKYADFKANIECRKAFAQLREFWAAEGIVGGKVDSLPAACTKGA